MAKPENLPADTEARGLTYIGHAIPWYVRLLWLGFWILAVFYVLRWVIPAFRTEILNPP